MWACTSQPAQTSIETAKRGGYARTCCRMPCFLYKMLGSSELPKLVRKEADIQFYLRVRGNRKLLMLIRHIYSSKLNTEEPATSASQHGETYPLQIQWSQNIDSARYTIQGELLYMYTSWDEQPAVLWREPLQACELQHWFTGCLSLTHTSPKMLSILRMTAVMRMEVLQIHSIYTYMYVCQHECIHTYHCQAYHMWTESCHIHVLYLAMKACQSSICRSLNNNLNTEQRTPAVW